MRIYLPFCLHYDSTVNELLFCTFNVFHVRALYYTKNIKHQQMRKGFFFSSLVTHSYMFRPCWVIFRANFLPWLHYGCTQYTFSSSTIKCNHSVTTAESSPWRWPSRVETCRSVLQVMKKIPLCICLCLMFFFFCTLFTACTVSFELNFIFVFVMFGWPL
jgi:hypothetical protein